MEETIRDYRKLVRIVIEKTNDNKKILIDKEILKYFHIHYDLQNEVKNNEDSELSEINESIRKEKNVLHGSINFNLTKWVVIALMSPTIILLLINFIIPIIVGIFLILTVLF